MAPGHRRTVAPVDGAPGRAEPEWVQDALLWHLHPLTFVGAPATAEPGSAPVPRLLALLPWLDHLVALGANALLLGPVFASHTHGYDTVDHFRVDPRLGSEADLVQLIEQAHRRGVRVVLDGVFNHVGRGFGPLRDVEEHGARSAYASWFRRGADGSLATFEGHDILVALDHDEPAVLDHVVGVMRYWLARGVDGWRLDAAYAVPSSFWARVSAQIRAGHPDAWLVGEVIHGDYAQRVEQSGWHSATQYELWKAVWSSLNDRNLFELAHALERHDALLSRFAPQTFVGNHDVTRIASRLDDGRHLPHALALLLTVGGTPSVYAGDELGWRGVKEDRVGGDDAVRPAFPPSPGDVQMGDVGRLHQQLIGVRRRHRWLHRAPTSVQHLTNTGLVYASTGPDAEVVVALNVGDTPLEHRTRDAGWRVEAGNGTVEEHQVRVPAHGWLVASRSGPG
jgi:glycosidase